MSRPALIYLGLLLTGLILNFTMDGFYQIMAISICVNMLLGMSLNLVNGYTGQFSIGHAGFMAVGAYLSAWLSLKIPPPPGLLQIPYFIFLALLGGLASGFAGYLVGLPSLRLKGDYLAIVTLGFGEIIRVVLLNLEAVGGARGLTGIPGLEDAQLFGVTISRFILSYSLASFWVLLCFVLIWRLIRSAEGRGFLAVREDEIAAEAMGVNTTQSKINAFVISSFFAGVAGSAMAHYTQQANFLTPASFTFNRSVDVIIIVVLGGMGSLSGSLVAAVFVTLMPELLRPLQEITGVDLRMVIYSLALVLLMIVRPKGLFGHLEFSDLWKTYVKKTT